MQGRILTYPPKILLLLLSHQQVCRSGAHEEVVSPVSCQSVCLHPAAAAAADQASCQCVLSLKHEAKHINGMRSCSGIDTTLNTIKQY